MTTHSTSRFRQWIADDLDRLAVVVWGLAHHLRPVDDTPRCPDCQIGPDVGDNCPMCEGLAEAKHRDNEIYGSGFEDGHRAGARDMEERLHGPF